MAKRIHIYDDWMGFTQSNVSYEIYNDGKDGGLKGVIGFGSVEVDTIMEIITEAKKEGECELICGDRLPENLKSKLLELLAA